MRKIIGLCLAAHVISGFCFFLIWSLGWRFALSESGIEALGQLFSSLDIALGLVVYVQANRPKPNFVFLLIPCVFSVAYVAIGGNLGTAALYQAIALGIQGLFTYRYMRLNREK